MARAIVAHPRARDAVIVGLGLVGALSYLDGLQARGFLHGWDVYHYYVGARYFPELGYDGLYACSTAADAEDLGVEQVAPAVRNLESHRVEPGHAALRAAAQCRARFSPDRWAAFKHDVAWFRERIGPGQWRRVLRDHGFNGTPAWLVLGRTLAETGPASRAQLLALVLVDPMLLAGAGAVIARVFGWRPLCLAVGFFGLNYPARVGWTAGAFLRQDWLVATVVGVALLKRNRPVAAGAALGVAALLRIFPALVLAGLAVSAAVDAARGRTMAARTFMPRVLLGVAIAAAAVVPASFLVAGPAAWPAFARKAAVHAGTPLTNHIGLKTVVAYEHATRAEMSAPLALDADAFQPWKDARRRTFHERWPVFALLATAFVVLFVRAVRDQPPWITAVLAAGLVPVALELTGYYYSLFLVFAFLSTTAGVALCVLGALTWLVGTVLTWQDVSHTVASLLILAFVAVVWIWYAAQGTRWPAHARGHADDGAAEPSPAER